MEAYLDLEGMTKKYEKTIERLKFFDEEEWYQGGRAMLEIVVLELKEMMGSK